MNLIVGLALLLGAQEPEAPISIQHPDPKFRMTIPRGYQEAPSRPSNLSYSYRKAGPDGAGFAINVEVLDGGITPEPIPEAEARASALKKFPPGSQFRFGRAMWGDHSLQVLEYSFTLSGTELFSAVVQLPTLPRAVQLGFAGPKASEAEVREDMRQVLQSFRGATAWLTPRQRLLAGLSGGSAVVAWSLLLIYGILYAALFRKNPLQAWKFRVAYLCVIVVAFAVAIAVGPLYQMSKGSSKLELATMVLTAAALAVAVNTGRLFQAGRESSKLPAAA